MDRREESAELRESTADKTKYVLRFYHRPSAPKAVAAWEFDDLPRKASAGDVNDGPELKLGRDVQVSDGALWLGTSDAVTRKPIRQTLDEHTLEAWVAELPSEEDASEPPPVHLVLARGREGAWTAYRNGVAANAESVRQELPMSLEKGRVRFAASEDAPLRVLQARLYDRALRPDDVAASALGNVEAAPEEEQARIYRGSWAQIARLEAEADRLERSAAGGDAWRQLAHAMFNLKEFMYLR